MIAETAIKIVGNPTTTSGPLSSTATYNTNKLFAGSGNSNDKFAITKFADAGIELGLSGRIAGVGATTGEIGNDGLVHFSGTSGDKARFAYSIASEDKQLSEYTFKLLIDTNPGENQQTYTTYTLGAGPANSYDVQKGKYTNGGGTQSGLDSNYTWKKPSEASHLKDIKDDGGDGSTGKVTQNIENISWFDSSPGDSNLEKGHYDVILQAWSKDGATLIGTNHVVFDITGVNPA